MERKTILKPLAAVALSVPMLAQAYVVTIDLPRDLDGAPAVLTIDAPARVRDTTTVVDNRAVFTGTVAEPYLAMITVDDQRVATFYVCEDSVFVKTTKTEIPGGVRTDWAITGGEINAARQRYQDRLNAIIDKRYDRTFVDSIGEDNISGWVSNELGTLLNKYLTENIDNAFGADIAVQLKKGNDFYDEHPSLKRFPATQRYFDQIRAQNATRPGEPFVNFTIDFNGETHSLSDIAGKGKYVLVDFWASWCGPCRASMPMLRELYKEYAGKPFEIIGIPVNDNPDDSRRAVEELGITWPVWYTAKSDLAAANAYSVNSIPSTFLIGPDGKILLNRPSEDELKSYLHEALGK